MHGGSVTRQVAGLVTVSMLGTIYTDIAIDPSPGLSVDDAASMLRVTTGRQLAFGEVPSLVILPMLTGRYALAYRATMANETTYFIDAGTGDVLWQVSERREQGQVGVGTGVLGDLKKMSTTLVGGTFRTQDQLRPSGITTLDTRGSATSLQRLLENAASTDADFSTDSDNSWADPRVVDAHVHSGWTTDYFFKRFGWSGFDGIGSRLFTIVHRSLVNNAFFTPPPFGPGRSGAVVFGDSSGGVPVTALDVAAHEVMHGVTYFSVRRRTGSGLLDALFIDRFGPTSVTIASQTFPCNTTVWSSGGVQYPFLCDAGRYVMTSNHPGAANEAFSDVFGTSAEFFFQPPGSGPLKADYVIAEDVPAWARFVR